MRACGPGVSDTTPGESAGRGAAYHQHDRVTRPHLPAPAHAGLMASSLLGSYSPWAASEARDDGPQPLQQLRRLAAHANAAVCPPAGTLLPPLNLWVPADPRFVVYKQCFYHMVRLIFDKNSRRCVGCMCWVYRCATVQARTLARCPPHLKPHCSASHL